MFLDLSSQGFPDTLGLKKTAFFPLAFSLFLR
jgi:hypothetical protein